MKRTLLFIACVLASLTMSAQEELAVENIQDSGCLNLSNKDEAETRSTIVLTKEGSVLSVQLLNYFIAFNVAIDFNVISTVSGGSDGEPCSVNIRLVPSYPDYIVDRFCWYNVSFTVRDLETNTFYLKCWWYEGLVTLEEGKPLVLEDIYEEATIDGMTYMLRKIMGRAMLIDGNTQKDEVRIPSELNYEGKTYSVTSIGYLAFLNNKDMTKVFIPKTIMYTDLDNRIGFHNNPFFECTSLQSIEVEEGNPAICSVDGVFFNKDKTILFSYPAAAPRESYKVPESVTWIESRAFNNCSAITSLDLPESVTRIGSMAFAGCKLSSLYIRGVIESDWMTSNIFDYLDTKTKLYVQPSEVKKFQAIYKGPVYSLSEQTSDDMTYRPFVEEGKVWKVGYDELANPVQLVRFYYFDGETIIDGKACKQMMCRLFVSPDQPNYDWILSLPSLYNEGAWYEEDKKVYTYDMTNKQFMLMYDFSADANDTIQIKKYQYVVGPKQTGGINGFKGIYQDVRRCEESGENSYSPTWMEGVGSIDGPTKNVYYVDEAPSWFLMSCYVGDEVIYHNDAYEDGATPEEARKKRFDFTHTIKTKPKSRMTRGADPSLYGEYNEQQLGINLDPLDDAYLVRITDDSGKTVYEKAVNAGSIVGLNIDISDYAEGRYTVTVENSNESFSGEFDAQTTGLSDSLRLNKKEERTKNIYNLQGQRLSSLQKGLNIVNGQKIHVK